MVFTVKDFGEGGRGPHNDRLFLPISGTGSPVIWRGGVGGDPADWTSPGELPPQGDEKDGGYANLDTDRWDLVLPPLDDALRSTGLETMETYISRIHNTVAQYIATRPILKLFMEAERRP